VKEFYPKNYNNFKDIYNDGYNLANEIKAETQGMSANKRVEIARCKLNKNILNCYFIVGTLAPEVISELNTTSNILKFSMDNIIKNCIIHSDVCFEDYLKIPEIAKFPTKILKSKNGYDVILFKEKEKYYKLIIKTTKNKNENFIKSFHLLREKRYNQYK
jgi:hypothetical protein